MLYLTICLQVQFSLCINHFTSLETTLESINTTERNEIGESVCLKTNMKLYLGYSILMMKSGVLFRAGSNI